MLNLQTFIPQLDRVAERFLDESLPESLSPEAFAALDLSAYSAEDIAYGREAWALRSLDEYRSMVDFVSLLEDVTQLGLSFEGLTCVMRLVRDESRHVELCKRMHIALGGKALLQGTPNWCATPPNDNCVQRVYHRVIASLCIGETASVAMINGVRNHTANPLAKELLTSLLRDESFHSRLGWLLLDYFYQHDPEGISHFLRTRGPSYLSAVRRALIPRDDLPDPILHSFGSMKTAIRRQIALESIETMIIKPMRAYGVDLAGEPARSVVA